MSAASLLNSIAGALWGSGDDEEEEEQEQEQQEEEEVAVVQEVPQPQREEDPAFTRRSKSVKPVIPKTVAPPARRRSSRKKKVEAKPAVTLAMKKPPSSKMGKRRVKEKKKKTKTKAKRKTAPKRTEKSPRLKPMLTFDDTLDRAKRSGEPQPKKTRTERTADKITYYEDPWSGGSEGLIVDRGPVRAAALSYIKENEEDGTPLAQIPKATGFTNGWYEVVQVVQDAYIKEVMSVAYMIAKEARGRKTPGIKFLPEDAKLSINHVESCRSM